jgi:hypothetical protein
VLLHNLDLALLIALDDGRVVGVDQIGFGMEVFDQLVGAVLTQRRFKD